MPQQNDPVTELYHALGLVGLGFTIAGVHKALTAANLAVIATPQSDRLETHNPAIAAELHLAAHRALGQGIDFNRPQWPAAYAPPANKHD